ncbi:MarR family winged helix-turn-helix transcriptional regulator [Streptomyces mexicanus]|jgi:DNA-binding MarR family transcriptional regulator|uniref:MarR family winged helix-turn-helix transcriptional regulator n=1 Tax=Streptomyces mexicanus TaxID=178566 RepID=UPI00365FE256
MGANAADVGLQERWRDILAVHARTLCEIDRVLHPYGLGASDFEVLDVLASAAPGEDGDDGKDEDDGAGGRCRVHDLAARVHLSQSALSRLVGRLERDGLVERSTCADDRRGVRVVLTGKGRALHAEVLPLQRAVLARMLGD